MILHLDMDAFFASVEQLDRPELKGKCLIVGGASPRAVVTTASYEARKFGVRSAMPMFEARKRCPHAIIVPGRMARYKEISGQVMALLGDFTPLVEPVSIDEAYLDISGCERLFGSLETIGAAIKKTIFTRLHLTCSVGIAPLRFLAKIASDLQKPDGLTVITPDQVAAFIDRLPIHKIPGVGRKAQGKLGDIGVKTLGQVRGYPIALLERHLGKFGHRLAELAQGIDPTPVTPFTPAKSFSAEVTLSRDTRQRAELLGYLLRQADDVGRQLRRHGVRARTVTLKLKYADFHQITRSATLKNPTQTSETVYEQAAALLASDLLLQPVRLVGVGASNLVSADVPRQLDLFATPQVQRADWEKIDRAVDAINLKFGGRKVEKGSLIVPPSKNKARP
jgi:DNA polymerase-4